jgi:hypothetical protein
MTTELPPLAATIERRESGAVTGIGHPQIMRLANTVWKLPDNRNDGR